MKIYYFLILVLFCSCKQAKINRVENLADSSASEIRCIPSSNPVSIDSTRVTTELSSQAYELLLGKGGSYWLISSNETFNSKNGGPLNGRSYRGTLASKEHKDLFELINREDFKENCRFSTFYKDSVQVCRTATRMTHTAITSFQLWNSNCVRKEFKFYQEDPDESWRLTKKAFNLIRGLITEIELKNKKSDKLPAYQFRRRNIKKVTLSYAIEGEYADLQKHISHNEISISEYHKLIQRFESLKKINPFFKSNIDKNRYLKEIFKITIQFNDNRSERLWVGPKYLRIKNRRWISLDKETKKVIQGYVKN